MKENLITAKTMKATLDDYQVTYPPKVYLLIYCNNNNLLANFPDDRKDIYLDELNDFIAIAQHHYDTASFQKNEKLDLLQGLQELNQILISIWKIEPPTKTIQNQEKQMSWA